MSARIQMPLLCAGIQDMLSKVCKTKNINEEEFFGGLKKKGQWHVEVY